MSMVPGDRCCPQSRSKVETREVDLLVLNRFGGQV